VESVALWKEYGLVGLTMFAVITLLFFVIKWTLATTKDIMRDAAIEREAFRKCIDEHTMQAKEFHTQVNEAHKYQREEHKEIAAQLKEVTITLGRINGYKDSH